MYHTSTTGKISTVYCMPNTGRFSTATPSTPSAMAATNTTTTIPALCQMPARATALDHSPLDAAAALPLIQSITMHTAQASTSHPSQPKAAENAAHSAVTAALSAAPS